MQDGKSQARRSLYVTILVWENGAWRKARPGEAWVRVALKDRWGRITYTDVHHDGLVEAGTRQFVHLDHAVAMTTAGESFACLP